MGMRGRRFLPAAPVMMISRRPAPLCRSIAIWGSSNAAEDWVVSFPTWWSSSGSNPTSRPRQANQLQCSRAAASVMVQPLAIGLKPLVRTEP
jgi:hypothetical protein